jgi:hypothetical protein
MIVSNRQRIDQALQYISVSLAPIVDEVLTEKFGTSDWPEAWSKQAKGKGFISRDDPATYLRAITDLWYPTFSNRFDHDVRSWAGELRTVRNKWAHGKSFSDQRTKRALETAALLLAELNKPELAAKVEKRLPAAAEKLTPAVPNILIDPALIKDTVEWIPTHLVVTAGSRMGTRIPLDQSPITIGRSPDSVLVLPDDYASSRHAEIYQNGDKWFVKDMGSTNGTYVGDQPIYSETYLGPGMSVRIGGTVLELQHWR